MRCFDAHISSVMGKNYLDPKLLPMHVDSLSHKGVFLLTFSQSVLTRAPSQKSIPPTLSRQAIHTQGKLRHVF